jgi:peptide/nickel transport system permease protein
MLNFVLRRFFYGILVLFGVVTAVFLMFNVLPGDPARQALGQRADEATLEAVRAEFGLDEPLHIQYFAYLNDLSPLSLHEATKDNQDKYGYFPILEVGSDQVLVAKAPYLRRSYQSRRPVSSILKGAFPQTALLAFTALCFASIVGVVFGVLSALYRYSWRDHTLMIMAIVGIGTPSFFSAILFSWIFGYVLADTTHLNMFGGLYDYHPFEGRVVMLKNLILPAITLGIRPLAIVTQLTRSSMLDVMSMDYVRTAVAKGMKQRAVIVKHALRNALNPVMTAVSGWLASLLGGAFFVEYIFDWKGVGKVTIDALNKNDFPVVMGAVLLIAVIFIVVNLLVDIMYGVLDPRARVR